MFYLQDDLGLEAEQVNGMKIIHWKKIQFKVFKAVFISVLKKCFDGFCQVLSSE